VTDPQAFDEALILTGPTASGKSAVGLALAERLGAEVVAMDSMTLYRGLDIGTAKPTPDERRRVPHHLIDVLDPWESASVAWWLDRAAAACRDVAARGRRALFVGGTPLYLKALLHGLFEGPAGDPVLRARLEREPGPELHARLALVDPASAARLHPHDVRRLVRALEVFELTGRPISSWQDHFDKVRPRRFPPVWLDLARPVLYERINRRVAAMMRAGLLDEVRRLRALPRPLSKEARQALGYKELFDHLEGRIDLEGAVGLIQTRSRQFAKRQLTWLRHMPGCQALPVAGDEPPDEVAGRVQQIWFPAS
jgi:tRNA dimethylallyltransferase